MTADFATPAGTNLFAHFVVSTSLVLNNIGDVYFLRIQQSTNGGVTWQDVGILISPEAEAVATGRRVTNSYSTTITLDPSTNYRFAVIPLGSFAATGSAICNFQAIVTGQAAL